MKSVTASTTVVPSSYLTLVETGSRKSRASASWMRSAPEQRAISIRTAAPCS
jgi:hypothetical protein